MKRIGLVIVLAAAALGCTSGHIARPAVPAQVAVSITATPNAGVAATGASGSNQTAIPGTAQTAAPVPTSTTPYVLADPRFDPMPRARAIFGRLGGATYQIEIPADWNGDLVLYAHGFTGTDPVLFVEPPPLRAYFIAHGFAWAASSFSGSGYDPDLGLQDTLALHDYFVSTVATPTRTYMYGTSMGGHVVVSAMEQHPELFAGGFSECGVVAGVEEIDYIDSYIALAGFLTSTPLIPVTSIAAYHNTVDSRVLPALGSGSSPTAAGKQFEDVLANLTGGPRPWRHQGFLDRRTANFDLPASEDPKHPSIAYRAGTNVNAHYHVDAGLGIDDATLNGQVPRLPADPAARNAQTHPDYAPRTGMLKSPLLTIHTTGDHFVPISLEQSYRKAVNAAGAGDLLVQRAIRRPDHCQFSATERERGFSDLVQWVEHGVKPAGEDFSSGDFHDAGLSFTDPLLPGDPGQE
ncbi:MAG: alpha/beta hydrolase family protein [Dehalococcoidia bacterium]